MALLLIAVSAPDMSVKDVATYLRVTPRTVYTMMADGRLKATRSVIASSGSAATKSTPR